ncbi:MAG TPA: hypothetical protein VII00_01455 [bacterium]
MKTSCIINRIYLIAAITIIFDFCFLTSCANNKQTETTQPKQQTASPKSATPQFEKDIKLSEGTDQYYYQAAVDHFNSKEYDEAIDNCRELKAKFPDSPLKAETDRMIKESESKKSENYKKEQAMLSDLLSTIEQGDRADRKLAIAVLEAYLEENHPDDLKTKAKTRLEKYKKEFERIKAK